MREVKYFAVENIFIFKEFENVFLASVTEYKLFDRVLLNSLSFFKHSEFSVSGNGIDVAIFGSIAGVDREFSGCREIEHILFGLCRVF